MAMATERMNITIPKELAIELKKLTNPRKRSAFINDAIRLKIDQQKKESLRLRLEEGYKSQAKDASLLAKEFEAVDLEHWDEY